MKDPYQIIEHILPVDALSILRALAASDEGLARRIAEMALAHVGDVDPEEVAAVLYDGLDNLEVLERYPKTTSSRHIRITPHPKPPAGQPVFLSRIPDANPRPALHGVVGKGVARLEP